MATKIVKTCKKNNFQSVKNGKSNVLFENYYCLGITFMKYQHNFN